MANEAGKIEKLFSKLCNAELRTFPPFRGRLDAPAEQGVYIIYSPRGKVVHVGTTPRAKGGIAQRLRNHIYGLSSFTYVFLNGDGSQLREAYQFRCLAVPNPRHRALLEAYAIGHLCPAHLGVGSQKE